VVAAAYRGKGKNASVALVVEFGISQINLVDQDGVLTGNVELTYLATDAKGKVRPGGRRHAATLSLKKTAPGTAQSLRTGARAVSEFELPPGRYQLRVAIGSAVRAGSVVYDLEVPDFADQPLMLSGISLTTGSAPAVLTLNLKDPLGTALPGPPVAVRDFARGDTLAMYVEVYENAKALTPATVSAELRSEDGTVTHALTQRTATSSVRANTGSRGVTAALSLAAVPPGSYILHVEARSGTDVAGKDIPIRVF